MTEERVKNPGESDHDGATIILRMIESVDPVDTAKMDEIDARFWCWLRGIIYEEGRIGLQTGKMFDRYVYPFPLKYTRSRDALKAIRPEGFFSVDENGSKGWQAWINRPDDKNGPCFIVTGMPTEELAELHVIIQAIAYERNKS